MLCQIVLLYICCLCGLPTWCKAFTCISLGLNIAKIGYGFCKEWNKAD